MQKLTVFYIGATIVVIGVLAGLIGYEYATRQRNGEITRQEEHVIEKPQEEEPEETTQAVVSERKSPKYEEDEPLVIASDPEFTLATITEEKVLKAGFGNPAVSMDVFGGVIFTEIDLGNYRSGDHISYKISENRDHAGNITEFVLENTESADELYSTLKLKIQENESFVINETNQYGDNSFFANYDRDTNSVFLVVKLKSRLYTLHYPAKNHNKMKNLILLLS